ncbi:TonB-dependent receptor [Pseudomaricurvus alkylphenolicus]|uniref:TonB-dependent receptor n=1 Tax=Pseudomaricurvus alkylphenolicus TaxID=1306991 RepID=UPI001423A8BE|nr:TonB-dependent receptor [Pseudomaricurvus alkylphenolicus]NIB41640.1 TonB-dependent receptor [Pseudomaricurvus alkylphenolicus]
MKKTTSLAVAAAVSLGAIAEEPGSFALEEVVVTAQKRAQDMQDVPIAVTAMSAEMIKQAGISDMKGIAVRTPGFSMGSFNPAQPQMFIRGIGSNGDGAGGGEQSVALFLDGVYINRSAGAGTELYDLESIEVLRGPQGTLWGKNAIAGAINLTSKRPSEELEASLEVGAGNYGLQSYRGMVTGPLAENINGKISFSRKNRDAYVDSVIDPDIETGDLDSGNVRAQVLVTPQDNLELLLTLDYGTDERSGSAVVPAGDQGLVGMFLQSPALPQTGFHENYLEDAGRTHVDAKGISLQVDWDNDFGTLTSLTAWRESATAMNQISLGTGITAFPVLTIDNFVKENSEMLSQEFRLAGEQGDLNWQAGIYYNNEKTNRTEGGAFTTAVDLGALFTGGGVVPLGTTIALPDDFSIQGNETTSVAIFGQGTYSLTEDLDLTLGVRYTREEKDFTNVGTGGAGLYVLESYDVAVSETWTAPTYKLVVNYHVNDDTMVYLSAASGFKSGGFDGTASTGEGAATPFDEEQALNLELGFKSMLLDRRLRLNGALFNTQYEDLQILQTFPNGSPVPPLQTKNAGEAVSQGIELEATLALTENLQLSATYAYLDTEYTQLDGNLEPHEGNKLRNAPKHAYSLAALYDWDLESGGSVNARAEYVAKDQAYQDVQNVDYAAIPAYRVTNLRLTYVSPEEHWEVAGWINNAFDEEYYLHNYALAPFGAFHIPAMPRTVGVTATWNLF